MRALFVGRPSPAKWELAVPSVDCVVKVGGLTFSYINYDGEDSRMLFSLIKDFDKGYLLQLNLPSGM